MEKAIEYRALITQRLEKYEKLVELEKSTGVDKFYLFSAGSVALGMFLFVVGGARLVVHVVGFVYPAYQSFKALSSEVVIDDTQWLTYWVVFALFNMTETVTDFFFSWIPLYFVIKIAFLVWCYHPATLGANIIYHSIIEPNITKHISAFETVLKATSDAAKNIAEKLE